MGLFVSQHQQNDSAFDSHAQIPKLGIERGGVYLLAHAQSIRKGQCDWRVSTSCHGQTKQDENNYSHGNLKHSDSTVQKKTGAGAPGF
jgi:hypothetical protein